MNGWSRSASSARIGRQVRSTSSSISTASNPGTGANDPMPPVFGPTVTVLRPLEVLCDGEREARTCRRRARTPRSRALRGAPRSRASPPRAASSARPASTSACVWQTTTPLPAASPSALSTHGAIGLGEGRRGRDSCRGHHLLGEGLRSLDRRRALRGAEHRDAAPSEARPRDRRRAAPRARRRRGRSAELARGRAPPRCRPREPGGTGRARRCPGSRAQRAAPSAPATGRASRRAHARDHRIRREGRARCRVYFGAQDAPTSD